MQPPITVGYSESGNTLFKGVPWKQIGAVMKGAAHGLL